MDGNDTGSILGGAFAGICFLAIFLVMVASGWKVFTKAGQPGWAVLVPIYNLIVLMQIIGKPGWWWLLLYIPFYGIWVAWRMIALLAKSFGQSTGFAVGMLFLSPIFYPILGFGSARYLGPASSNS
jgi:uncharacterized membrane protein YhaH (DUF805 family)